MPANGAARARKTTRMDRAKQERMYFMGRANSTARTYSFIVTGQSGKVYTVSLPRKGTAAASPSSRDARFRCNCVDNLIRKGTCKHMLFVCLRVLRISEEQLKGLENGRELDISFLHEVLERVAPEVDEAYTAPAALKQRLKAIAGDFEADGEVPRVAKREPEEGDMCPICYDDMLDDTKLVYCGYGCGKPVHEECFERYRKAQHHREVSDKLRCVTCRMDWEVEASSVIGSRGLLIGRRAINLAESMPEQFADVQHPAPPTTTRRTKSSKTAVRAGRVSKTKTATKSKSKTSTKRTRSSARIAGRKAEPATEVVSKATKRGRKTATGKSSAATSRSTRSSSSKAQSGWTDAVLDDPDALKRSQEARRARAARRNAARVTRSMTA